VVDLAAEDAACMPGHGRSSVPRGGARSYENVVTGVGTAVIADWFRALPANLPTGCPPVAIAAEPLPQEGAY
jgi:hypothetical protein